MFGNPSYPSYRVFLAVAFAALVTMILMPFFIRLMTRGHIGQQIRADGPGSHLVKQGTPTMGGVVILIGALVACALQAKWSPDLILAVAATPRHRLPRSP
jgi:phospho-N-acetylmuramoyl-pentapeptide-transferase